MPTEEHMTVNERRKYLKLMKPQYEAAPRKEKKRMLSDMQAVTGLHRKSLLRLLNESLLERKKRKTPRQRSYGPQVEQVILQVWESLDYVCAERLTPVLLRTAQHLARFGVVQLTTKLEQQLERISEASVTRRLAQASPSQAALTAQRARTSEPGTKRGADETHSVGHDGAGT